MINFYKMKNYKILFLFILFGYSSCKTFGQQPDNTKPMYGEITKSAEHKKIDEVFVKDCLDKFGSIDSSVNVYTDYAWSYFYNNDLKTAMKRFNQVWLLDSEFPDSYFGFAALMEMQGNIPATERFYKLGMEKDKTKQRAQICFHRIADCKEQLQDYKGTIEAYEKISELNPTDLIAFKKIGYYQMQMGNYEKALTAYGKAIELDPSDAMTYNNRAYLYQTIKDYKNANADYTKAIELDPNYISAYVNRGITSMEEGNYEAAKKDFEVCVQLDSNTGELRRFLGISKLYLNDKTGACKEFKLAKELGDNQADELISQNCK